MPATRMARHRTARVGCPLQCPARTTESYRPAVWCPVWRRRMPLTGRHGTGRPQTGAPGTGIGRRGKTQGTGGDYDPDSLGAHARDGIGISAAFRARPIQAALASAVSFAAGAAMPLAVTAVAQGPGLIPLSAERHCYSWRFCEDWLRAREAQEWRRAHSRAFRGALAMALTANGGASAGTVTGV
jgi:hypothetical protein